MASRVISHQVDLDRGAAVLTLEDGLGRRRQVQINLANQKGPCACCGRAFPQSATGQPDVQAITAAELADMDAIEARLRAYATANNLKIGSKS